MLILRQQSLLNFPHLEKKKPSKNLAFKRQNLLPKRDFSFSTASSPNTAVSHGRALPAKQFQNPTTPYPLILPKPRPLINRQREHFAREATKISPVVQKLQIKLRDKELPQGPPWPRRPPRCPTGPSRLRAPQAPQPGPRRGAAALRPSLRRAGPGPITRRYSPAEISPPRRRGGSPRGRSSHRRMPSGRSRYCSRAMAERGQKYLAAQDGRVAQRGRGDRTKLPPIHTHTLTLTHRLIFTLTLSHSHWQRGTRSPVRSALAVPAAPRPRPPGLETPLIRWSHTHLPSPLQRVFKGIVHSSSPAATSPGRARGRRGHRGIVRHGLPGAAPAAAAVCQEREKMAAGARLSHSCAASCSGGAR